MNLQWGMLWDERAFPAKQLLAPPLTFPAAVSKVAATMQESLLAQRRELLRQQAGLFRGFILAGKALPVRCGEEGGARRASSRCTASQR